MLFKFNYCEVKFFLVPVEHIWRQLEGIGTFVLYQLHYREKSNAKKNNYHEN